MTHKPEEAAAIEEEIILPENLLPLGAVLGAGVTPLDVSMVLAKVFNVQYAEVALLRLDGGLLKFIFPEHLRTTGAIPISSKAVAAHTALSKKAEIFNNFARVKHASIFETIKPVGSEVEDAALIALPLLLIAIDRWTLWRAPHNRIRRALSIGVIVAAGASLLATVSLEGSFRWVRARYQALRIVSGATLVALGLLLFFHLDWWLRVGLNQVFSKIGLGSKALRASQVSNYHVSHAFTASAS